jgi:hypothetical protein
MDSDLSAYRLNSDIDFVQQRRDPSVFIFLLFLDDGYFLSFHVFSEFYSCVCYHTGQIHTNIVLAILISFGMTS